MATLALTTKVDVKKTLGKTSVDDDTVIEDLIAAVSQEAEGSMGRWLLVAARTEIYTLKPNRQWLSLKAYPITSVASVKYASGDDFSAVDVLDPTTYTVRNDLGQIRFSRAAVVQQYCPGFVQVVYTGGMALDTTAFKAAWPRLGEAARTEVINRFNRRTNPEGSLQALGVSIGYQSAMKPLEDFYTACGHYRRLRL